MAKSKKEVAPKKEVKEEKKVDNRAELIVEVNGEVYKEKTNDPVACIAKINPPAVKTAVKVTLKKGKREVTRILFNPRARQLFKNEDVAIMFFNGLKDLL